MPAYPTAASEPSGRGLRAAARIVMVALQFLTRLPVPAIPVVDGDLRRATAVFPLIGLLVGSLAAGAFAVVATMFSGGVAAVVAVVVAVAVTGAFHEDGLADTFDGLWGGWEPQRRVEIMRDSRIGVYGVCALAGSLGLQVALLASLATLVALAAIVVGHVVGRASILVQICWLPPVSDQGHGAKVAEPVGPLGASVAAVTTLAVVGVALGPLAPVPLLSALLGIGAIRRAARRRIGGLTGDVLGATQQVALILATASVVVLDSLELLWW